MKPKSTTAFGIALGRALDRINYTHLAEPLMIRIAGIAADAAYDAAKMAAPVGNPADRPAGSEDPHPGKLRDSIEKAVIKEGASISAIIRVRKKEVPYVWTVIVGSRNHVPNGFMEAGRKAGFDTVRKSFRKVTQDEFRTMNKA